MNNNTIYIGGGGGYWVVGGGWWWLNYTIHKCTTVLHLQIGMVLRIGRKDCTNINLMRLPFLNPRFKFI